MLGRVVACYGSCSRDFRLFIFLGLAVMTLSSPLYCRDIVFLQEHIKRTPTARSLSTRKCRILYRCEMRACAQLRPDTSGPPDSRGGCPYVCCGSPRK